MSNALKVVVIGTRGFPNVQGGVEKHCEQLYPILVELGAQVTVLTRKPYIDLSIKEYKGIQLIPIDCPKSKFLEAVVHTFKAIMYARRLKPDLIHIHAIGPSLLVPLARLLGLKVVMTHHGPDYQRAKWNPLAKMVLMLGECMGVLFANRVIVISLTIAELVKRKYRRETILIPNGFSQFAINANVSENEAVLNQFGIKEGQYILAVGRFVPEKGFHDLLEAFVQAQSLKDGAGRTIPQGIKLVIAGDADHADEYSEKLKKNASQMKDVVLTGRLSAVPLRVLYDKAALFVLPSYYEGLPIVLLEALSFGINTIVSDISANLEVRLEARRYFPAGDIHKMAEKMVEFLNAPLSSEEKKACIDRVYQEYNWNKIAGQILEVYKGVSLR